MMFTLSILCAVILQFTANAFILVDTCNPPKEKIQKPLPEVLKMFDDPALLKKNEDEHKKFITQKLKENNLDVPFLVQNLHFIKKPTVSIGAQSEYIKTIDEYRAPFLTDISESKAFMKKWNATLVAAQKRFGVDKEAIIALMRIESNFGKNRGNIIILDSLFTLSYTSHRKDFFLSEFIAASKLAYDTKYNFSLDSKGSWAGASGIVQFMPSSIAMYAVDGDGDGIINIYDSYEDAIFSAANYLKRSGWKLHQPLIKEIKLKKNADLCKINGTDYTKNKLNGKILVVEMQPQPRAFIVYNNFNVVFKWNRSFSFVYAVDGMKQALQKKS